MSLLTNIQPERHFQALRVDPDRVDLVERFRQSPFGPHDPEVQELLYILRSGDLSHRYAVLYHGPRGPWTVIRVPIERSGRVEVLTEDTYNDRADAEWAVFKHRWRAQTGREIS